MIEPVVGLSKPYSRRKRDVFPAPFGPKTIMQLEFANSKETGPNNLELFFSIETSTPVILH